MENIFTGKFLQYMYGMNFIGQKCDGTHFENTVGAAYYDRPLITIKMSQN